MPSRCAPERLWSRARGGGAMVNFRTKKESASPKSPSGGGRRKRGDAEAAEGGGRGRKGTIWGQAYLATLYGSPEGSPAKTRRDAEARSRMLWSRIRAKLNLRSTEQRRRKGAAKPQRATMVPQMCCKGAGQL